MKDRTLLDDKFINPDPKPVDDIGYLHKWLRWTHEDISLPEGDKPVSPPTTPPNQFDPTLLGWGCVICGLILSSPKASQKGSEVTHPSVSYKYNQKVGAFRSISFRPIIANRAGEEVENPFKDRVLSRTSQHPTVLNMTEVVEYFHENHIHIKGVIVLRGGEEILKVPWHLPMGSVFIRRNLRFRVKGVFQLSSNEWPSVK
ncbi:hypothetical protein EAF04_007808 [Stromatinia cepivora]|nr:hypothetical protein EAF04_007808 [Stromatinia cepivora]